MLHQVNVPALRARVSPGLDDRDALAVAEVDARDAGLERESVTLFNWNELRDVSFFFSINQGHDDNFEPEVFKPPLDQWLELEKYLFFKITFYLLKIREDDDSRNLKMR